MKTTLYHKKASIILLMLIIASAISSKISAQPAAGTKMKLVWRDEFNKKGCVDDSKWSKIERSGAVNKGSCFASMSDDPRCLVIKNGKLYLRDNNK